MSILCHAARTRAIEVGWGDRFDLVHPYLHTTETTPVILAFAEALAAEVQGHTREAMYAWAACRALMDLAERSVVEAAEAITGGAS